MVSKSLIPNLEPDLNVFQGAISRDLILSTESKKIKWFNSKNDRDNFLDEFKEDSSGFVAIYTKTPDKRVEITFPTPLVIQGDVLFAFYKRTAFVDNKYGHCWINTNFIDTTGVVLLTKEDIDHVNKDKTHKNFPVNYLIEFHFVEENEEVFEYLKVADHFTPDFNKLLN